MTAIPLSESIIERNFKNELLSIENDALAALSKLAKRQYATCVGKKSPIAKCIMVNKDPAIYLLAHRDGHFVILVDDHSTSSLYYSIDGIRKDPQATASWGLLRALDEAGLLGKDRALIIRWRQLKHWLWEINSARKSHLSDQERYHGAIARAEAYDKKRKVEL